MIKPVAPPALTLVSSVSFSPRTFFILLTVFLTQSLGPWARSGCAERQRVTFFMSVFSGLFEGKGGNGACLAGDGEGRCEAYLGGRYGMNDSKSRLSLRLVGAGLEGEDMDVYG